MTAPLRVAVAGASGRMGRMLIDAVNTADDCTLAATLDIGCDIRAALSKAQVLIDFTRPEGTMEHLAACRELGVKAVIGTTGFTPAQKAEIGACAQEVALMLSPNMSVGVNVVLGLLATAARSLGDDYDVEIVELHHRHKIDAPSGTALAMGEAVAAATGRDLATNGVFVRHGVTGERTPRSIGFATLRGGDAVGDHTVMFCGQGERVEISHRSSSRATYAQGALRAARFLADKPHGLFDMADVLGLKPSA